MLHRAWSYRDTASDALATNVTALSHNHHSSPYDGDIHRARRPPQAAGTG